MNRQKNKNSQLKRRKGRVRKKVFGDADRPRLSIYRSLRHIYAQIIDDDNGSTLVAAGTVSDKLRGEMKNTGNTAAAAKVGEALARKALDMGIRQVRFDRNGCKYHGRIKALAEGARQTGLIF